MPVSIEYDVGLSGLSLVATAYADSAGDSAGIALTLTENVNRKGYYSVSTSALTVGLNWFGISGDAIDSRFGNVTASGIVKLMPSAFEALNSIQTGDSFAQIGLAGANLTSLGDSRLAKLDASISSRMATFTLPSNFSSMLISSSGNVGIDWGNVSNPTAGNSLANTTISTSQSITSCSVTNAIGPSDGVGTIQSATSTTIVLQTALGANHLLKGCLVAITHGTGIYQVRGIVDYVDSTKTLMVDAPWDVVPDGTSTYRFYLGRSPAIDSNLDVTANGVIGNVTGSVGSVLGGVTVTTNNDKSGYAITQAFPPNFGTLLISATGHISNVDNLTTYIGNTPQTGDAFGRIGAAGSGLTALGDSRISNLDAAVSSRLATSAYTAPTIAPTSAAIATAVWQDLLTSTDFSTTNSIGKLLKTDIDTNIGSRLPISGYTTPPTISAIQSYLDANSAKLQNLDAAISSRMASYTQPDGFLSAKFPNGMIANTTNITSASGINVAVNNDKSGYSLTQSFPTNFGTLLITATGHIANVDTLTTYTGNTPQTGDSFGRIGVAGAGLTAIGDPRIVNLDATVSSRLAASDYTASPTTMTPTEIATAVWQDLISSTDFSSPNSIGNLVKTNIDMNIGSRLATSSYVVSPTVADIQVFFDANSTKLKYLDAAISSRMAAYIQPSGFLETTFPSTIASPTNITAGTITTVSGNVNGSVGHVNGDVAGSVTSVSTGVTVTTNNDKTGYSLSGVQTGVTIPIVTTVANPQDSPGTTTLLTRLSSQRAGYLDNLNVEGLVASHSDETSLLTAIGSPLQTGSPVTLSGDFTPAMKSTLAALRVGTGSIVNYVTVPAEVAIASQIPNLISVVRGDTLRTSLPLMGDLSTRTKLIMTGKANISDPDELAVFQVVEGTGLIRLNSNSSVAPELATLTVRDATTGVADLEIEARVTAQLAVMDLVWDVQVFSLEGIASPISGTISIIADVTRAVT